MSPSDVHQHGHQPSSHFRLLFSAAWPGMFEVAELPGSDIEVSLVHRSVDWDVSRWRHAWLLLRDCVSLAWAAGRFDATIVCTGGLETFLVPLVWPFSPARRTPLIMLDPIALVTRRFDWLWRISLRQVALVLCIRGGDIATYGRRFGVAADRCRFIAMPAPPLASLEMGPEDGSREAPGAVAADDQPYIYSAGLAHRDWDLLFRACEGLPYRCIVSTPSDDVAHMSVPSNVEVHPALSPEEGRVLMRRAAVVAVTFEDTDLACGPTIVLDALAMGIPVVANDTNACRDYIVHGSTGLLSPTHDPRSLADNIRALMDDPERRKAMGAQAKRAAEGEFGRTVFAEKLGSIVRQAGSAGPVRR